MSSGLGPFFGSVPVSSRRRAATTTNRAPSPAQLQRAQEQRQRDAEIVRLNELRRLSTTVHLEDFAPIGQPMVPAPPTLTLDWAREQARKHYLQGIGVLARAERAAARHRGDAEAQAYLEAEQNRLANVHRDWLEWSAEWWSKLRRNDPQLVCDVVNAAFADNQAAGCAVGVDGAVLSIVIRQPDIDTLPPKMPGLTTAGTPTLKALTQRDRMQWWLTMLGSNVIASCREALAVAPGITAIDAVVLTRIPQTHRLGIVAYGRWTRTAINAARWETGDDALRFTEVGEVTCAVRRTASGNLSSSVKAIDVSAVPALAQLLADAEDEGVDVLTELDANLSGRVDARPTAATMPYQVRPFGDWLAVRARTVASLSSGENVGLPTELARELVLEFEATGIDTDLTLLVTLGNRKVRSDQDFIFYNNPSAPGGAVELKGATAVIRTGQLPPDVAAVLVSANIDISSTATWSSVRSATLTVGTVHTPMWKIVPVPHPSVRAVLLAEVYRHPAGTSGWKLRAIGEGWADGLAGLARDHGVVID